MGTLLFLMLLMVGLGILGHLVIADLSYNCLKIELLNEQPCSDNDGKTSVVMNREKYVRAASLLPNPQIIYFGEDLEGQPLSPFDEYVRTYEVTYENERTEKINAIYCKGEPFDFYYSEMPNGATCVYYAKDCNQPPHSGSYFV